MERLVEGGVYQAVIIHVAATCPAYGVEPADPPWFSEHWWKIFLGVCADAKELGIRLWFYDQLGFGCSNVQEGLIAQHPEYIGYTLEMTAGKVAIVRRGYDYLHPAAAQALIEAVHGEFARRAGNYFGSVIVGSFQDQLTPLLTWSRDFAVAFQRRAGYDIEPEVAALWGKGGPNAEKVRLDYQRIRAALAEEAFFRPLGEWHEHQGLLCGCDQKGFARRGYPIDCVRMYADYQRTHRWFSAPGSDHRGDTKIHSSLAQLYGRPRVWLEGFHSSGWGTTLEETFDWLIPYLRAGANLYNPHAVYYSTRHGWWEWAPPSSCWRQPYWRHYRHFARTVSRLCAVLSQGEHVCNVAVLFPTSTVQAGLLMDGVLPAAQRAHDLYLQIVGQMVWEDPKPGVLDRDRRDFDVLDEESVGWKNYRAIILPGCATLPAQTERALGEFEKAGGKAIRVTNADEVPVALADVERLVDAPVPTLRRRLDGQDLLLVPAAFPSATRHAHPESLLVHRYDFDPERYARTMRVFVRDVKGAPHIWEPYTGQRRPLSFEQHGASQEVVVDFQGEPLALIVWDVSTHRLTRPYANAPTMLPLDGPWDVRLIPTNDHPVQCWQFEHRIDSEQDWKTVHARFGPHGWWRRVDAEEWQPAIYSLSRGIYKDQVSQTLSGPHGYVPQEFLDFGEVQAGEGIQFRTTLHSPISQVASLVIAASAAKQAWLNGDNLGADKGGFHWLRPVTLRAGANELEFRLLAEETIRLRAFYAFVKHPERFVRPEWLAPAGHPRRDAVVRLGGEINVAFVPARVRIRVAAEAACRVLLNGTEVGRQAHFENPSGDDCIRNYECTSSLRQGVNRIAIEWSDPGYSTPSLVDALFESGEQRALLMSDAGWTADRGGRQIGVHLRRRHGFDRPWWRTADPAWFCLWRRPHPLPDAHWLEDSPADDTVLRLRPDAFPDKDRVEWFRFTVPPGTTDIHTDIAGDVQRVVRGGDCTLRVVPQPGHSGGAVFRQPVRFEVGAGRMNLGDWATQGLSAYAGGVCYSRVVRLDGGGDTVLDLGQVRGTAEVFVNGRSAGVRVWSPYRFDMTGFVRPGDNQIEIQIFNTLAPNMDAISPTPYVFPGQTESGLFGPVQIVIATRTRP